MGDEVNTVYLGPAWKMYLDPWVVPFIGPGMLMEPT